MRDALAPLRGRDFRLYFTGRTVSFAGTAMAPIALAFAVLSLGGDASDLGLVLTLSAVPQLVLLMVGGVLADRVPRHLVMVSSNVLSGLAQTVAAVLLLSGHAEVWHLAVVAFFRAIAASFFFPAQQGLVPQVVPAAQLQQANALLRTTLNATQIGGAALGGAIVAVAGPGWGIAIDALSYFVAAGLLAGIRAPSAATERVEQFGHALRAGWREFASRTWIWAVVLGFAFVNAAEGAAVNVLGPIVADRSLGGASVWGLVLAAFGIGLVLGGVVALRYRPARPLRAGVIATLPLALPVVLLAAEAPWPVLAVGALIAGVGVELFTVLWDTALQTHIPNDVLSRVASWDAVGSIGLMPIGFAAAGPLADAVGLTMTLWSCAALMVLAVALQLLSREVRELPRLG